MVTQVTVNFWAHVIHCTRLVFYLPIGKDIIGNIPLDLEDFEEDGESYAGDSLSITKEGCGPGVGNCTYVRQGDDHVVVVLVGALF